MAQVWLSFDEIQQVFGCDAADARKRVVANQRSARIFHAALQSPA
jgi:hypothetical protein